MFLGAQVGIYTWVHLLFISRFDIAGVCVLSIIKAVAESTE